MPENVDLAMSSEPGSTNNRLVLSGQTYPFVADLKEGDKVRMSIEAVVQAGGKFNVTSAELEEGTEEPPAGEEGETENDQGAEAEGSEGGPQTVVGNPAIKRLMGRRTGGGGMMGMMS